MSDQNRIAKFFDDVKQERGRDWKPKFIKDRIEMASSCARILDETMRAAGKVPMSPVSESKMADLSIVLVEYSLMQVELKGGSFMDVLAVSMGMMATAAVNDLALVAYYH